jgi:hypothetical protein
VIDEKIENIEDYLTDLDSNLEDLVTRLTKLEGSPNEKDVKEVVKDDTNINTGTN